MSDNTFYIRFGSLYLTRGDVWTADKLLALKLSSLEAVRHNFRRLRDYEPTVFDDASAASDEHGHIYPKWDLAL
jgi:hypothetical protein